MDAVTVRRALEADVEQIAELAGGLVRQHHRADPARFFLPDRVEQGYAWWLGRELGRSGVVILVAERSDRVVGYTYATLEGRDWQLLLDEHGAIHDLFVAEPARRSGIGKKLLEATVRALEELGASRIVLSTMVDNLPAQRLFAASGFRPTMLEMTRS